MTWSKQDALDYRRDWRERNSEKVRGYRRDARAKRAADKASMDPKAYRMKYFRELH